MSLQPGLPPGHGCTCLHCPAKNGALGFSSATASHQKKPSLTRSGLNVAAALTAALIATSRSTFRKRRNQRRGVIRFSGGEEVFDSHSFAGGGGLQLWLAEGLGPHVSNNFNERRNAESSVLKSLTAEFKKPKLDSQVQLEMDDRIKLHYMGMKRDFMCNLDCMDDGQPQEEGPKVPIRLLRGRGACLPPVMWNELLAKDDSAMLEYDFLAGLEDSGCVSLGNGWQPRFLLALRGGRSGAQLVGAVPLYFKMHSDGEFCEEPEWIETGARHKVRHWPRLFVGVPFTPHQGRRLVTAPWLRQGEQKKVQELLVEGLQTMAIRANASVNVAFPSEAETHLFQKAGFVPRTARQAWWTNRSPEPYSDFADFLRSLRLKNANEIEKQRAAVSQSPGVQIQVIDGSITPGSITPDLMAELFKSCYASTQLRHNNVGHSPEAPMFDLNENFFRFLGERMPNRVLLVLARHESSGCLIGGSLSFIKDGRISGRYWGSPLLPPDVPEVPFLHFECCYHAVIDHAIQQKYSCVEPGNGGGDIYKVQRRRGFEPVSIPSYHFIPNMDLREEVAKLAAEAAATVPSWAAGRNSAYAPRPREK
mmetsp:Transcript_43099/g.77952  ORF Transcript_43099/g.77952 Transcript_43099/m.77952 type:complete len:591 (+) Transcript_43099:98-1870(+)